MQPDLGEPERIRVRMAVYDDLLVVDFTATVKWFRLNVNNARLHVDAIRQIVNENWAGTETPDDIDACEVKVAAICEENLIHVELPKCVPMIFYDRWAALGLAALIERELGKLARIN